MATELRRQPIITNAIYIHIYTYNYIYIITFLQWIYAIPSRFYNQILTSTNQQKTDLSKRWPHIQNVIQTNAKMPTPINLAHIIHAAPQFPYISVAKFLSRIMRVYGGGFRLAIMRVYICGKIFALHNTHIKHGENPKNHNAKNRLESIKIFVKKMYMCGRFLKLHVIRLYSTQNLSHFNDLPN